MAATFKDVLFQPPLKDRLIHEMGLATPGNKKGYFKPQYEVSAGGFGFTLKEGDVLKDRNGYRWRITQIVQEFKVSLSSSPIAYIIVILKSIGLEGSG